MIDNSDRIRIVDSTQFIREWEVMERDVFCGLFVDDKEAHMQKNDPILINIPHSSTYIPPEEAGYFTKGYQKIKKDIEELLDILGHYSR